MGLALSNKDDFLDLVKKDGLIKDDLERTALFYIISENRELFERRYDIYDFKEHGVILDIMSDNDKGYSLSSGARSLLRLGYNLYNGYPADVLESFYNLDDNNYDIALNAVNIRFGKVRLVF